MKTKTILAAIAFASLGTSAFAQTYVGAGIGAGRLAAGCDEGVACKFTRPAGKVLAGYALQGTDFAVEAGFDRLGSFREGSGQMSIGIQASALTLGAAWRPQFDGGWGAVARVGAAYVRASTHVTGAIIGGGQGTVLFDIAEAKTTWQPVLGLGATYAITPNIRLAADWDHTRLHATFQGLSAAHGVNMVTLGATFGF